eukprot:1924949-Alexandrium_andersonii.AAC.1
MSASLVGSEMCIRDRVSVRARAPETLHGGGPGGGRSPPVRTVCKEAVSYTHLTLPTICSV